MKVGPYDRFILDYLAVQANGEDQTFRIALACGFDRIMGDLYAVRARAILLRLLKYGYVERPDVMGFNNPWWRITDKGRTFP